MKRRSILALLPFPALFLAGALAACQQHEATLFKSSPGGSSSTASEAEKTREMEKKAADLNAEAERIKTMEGSDQDKIDAVNRLEKQRRELNDKADAPPGQGEGQH
ncbi:MAG TPA: hypothetical protein VOA87_09945 [Thermoanaerobaculia bacterium]|nr:hypothetical protein [Thermoanaerobaculia bacterium]